MPSLTICQDADSFDIRDHVGSIKTFPVYWNRHGVIGRVPMSVFLNALELLDAYQTLQRRGRITDIPAAAFTITWDQTEDHRPESASKQAE